MSIYNHKKAGMRQTYDFFSSNTGISLVNKNFGHEKVWKETEVVHFPDTF